MMRIAISQRVVEESSYPERRDALDQRWASCLEAVGLLPVPVPNGLKDAVAWARAIRIQGLLLSGGNDIAAARAVPGSAPERDRLETLLLEEARRDGWPVLGVCRGMQMMNLHLGGHLVPVAGHVATRHTLRRVAQTSRFMPDAPDEMDVNSFHRFGIDAGALAPSCAALYGDAAGHVEAIEHRQLPWVGIMWHPEREPVLSDVDGPLLQRLFSHP